MFGHSVSSAGDVNGDGYGDLIVGAHRYDTGATTNRGAAFVYLGNGQDRRGPGLATAPQARQPGVSTPIAAGLTSSSDSMFDVALLRARGPWGRSPIAVQVEVKPLGVPPEGTGLHMSPAFTDSGTTGVAVQEEINGLAPGAGCHWRARVLVSPAQGQKQGWGPWKYGGLSGSAQVGHTFTTN